MSKRTKKLRLTKRDYDVLKDAATFGLIVPELTAPYRFAGKSPEAVKSTLRRLYGDPPKYRYLQPETLDSRRTYYRLTPRGARLIGAPRSVARRLGRQAAITRYALAWLIGCHRPHQRTLIDRQNQLELFGSASRLPKLGFFFEHTAGQAPTVGFALVDHGALPQRTVRKTVQLAARLAKSHATQDFLITGRLTLVVLTDNDQKRQEISRGLQRRLPRQLASILWRRGVDIRRQPPLHTACYVVPGLDQLIISGAQEHE